MVKHWRKAADRHRRIEKLCKLKLKDFIVFNSCIDKQTKE